MFALFLERIHLLYQTLNVWSTIEYLFHGIPADTGNGATKHDVNGALSAQKRRKQKCNMQPKHMHLSAYVYMSPKLQLQLIQT